MTNQEFKQIRDEVITKCEKYDFWEREVFPYSFKMTVRELTDKWREFDSYSAQSKGIFKSELKGFLPILERWIEFQEEPEVNIKMLVGKYSGKVRTVKQSIAENYIECEFAELA